MTIRKIANGETWFCDGCYLWWDKENGYFRLESIEGTLYNNEDELTWVYPRDKKAHLWCFTQYTAKDEPKCPECGNEGVIVNTNDNYWVTECSCHDTPIFEDPFDAWKAWEKYCKKGK